MAEQSKKKHYPVVRVTFRELVQIDKEMKSKKYGGNKESSNKSTEPVSANVTHKDMGQMTRSRRRSSHEEYSAHTSARQDETVISDRNDHLDRHVGRSKCAERPTCKEKHSRTKRPDMAIYVPRPKMALLKEQASTPLEEKATSDSESVDRDEEARMPLLLSYDSSFHISNDEFECNADEKTGTVDCKSSLKSGITIPTVVGTKASPLPKMVDNTGLEDIDPSRGFIVWNSRFGDQDSALGRSSSLEIVSNRQTLVTADVKLTGKGRGRLSRIRNSSSKSDTVPGKFEGPPSPSSSLPTIIEKLDINGPLSNYRRTSAVSQLGTSPKGIDEEQKNIGMSIAGSQASIGTETSAECENSISRNTATEEKLPLEFKRTRKILDWSAEVEAAEELEDVDSTSDDAWGHEIQKVDVSVIQETTNDSEKQEQKSEAKSGVRTKSSRRRAGKEKSTAERSGRRRSGRSKLSPEKDTDKTDITRISSSPKTDVTHISTSPKTEAARITSSPKTGGIIHVPVLSELPTPPLLPIATNTGMSPVDLSHDRKQLYDPDHPDRPLCVVPPAHHLSPFNRFLPEFGGSHHPVKPSFYPEVGPSSFPIPPSFSPSLPMPPHPGFVPGYHYPPMMPPPRGYFPSGQHPHHTIPVEGPYINPNVTGYKLSATEKNIHEAVMLEAELTIILRQPFHSMDLKKLGQCRWKIQLRYENTILSDMEFCAKHNIEQTLWRVAFYQVIESFRQEMNDPTAPKESIQDALINLIEEGTVFYENLLEKQQETYGFNLNHFLDSNVLRPHNLSRILKLTLLSAQKVVICLGDLARYREQASNSTNYGKARSWYLKAQQLAPKNGRPYNQLAILAVYARRKLDAVYYYMRSLAASNPFQTAKEGLVSIFDEVRKKYEQMSRNKEESRKTPLTSWHPQHSPQTGKGRTRHRQGVTELWYTPDGHLANQGVQESDAEQDEQESDDVRNLSPVELNKRFLLSFLHVHGKLYSRVGMETFAEVCVSMLQEFRLLLRMTSSPLNANRLLQIITINMFAIDNSGLRGTEAMVEPHCQSVIQGKALEVGMEMFRLLVDQCSESLREKDIRNLLTFDETVDQLLPAIKVWCDWFMCHPSVWNPLPSLTDLGTGSEKHDVWTRLAHLFNLLKRFNTSQILKEEHEGCEPVILPEDVSLAGFVPLLANSQEPMFVMPSADMELIRNLCRICRIERCRDFLCGINPPVLDYDFEKCEYIPVTSDPAQDSSKEEKMVTEIEQSSGGVEEMNQSPEDWDTTWSEDSTCQSLRTKKQQLEKAKARQEMQQQQIQEVLQQASLLRKERIEVHPKWLVPDTNCFINHLHHIRALVRTGAFRIAVPLVVSSELDGLAHGQRGHMGELLTDPGAQVHAQKVSQEAQKAIGFLNECFTNRTPNVKAVTAKGSIMDSMAFKSEAGYDKLGTNDDVILTSCIALESREASRRRPQKSKDKDGVRVVFKSVVLLTDDRNLRVKAHAQEMAVRDLPWFISLMNVG